MTTRPSDLVTCFGSALPLSDKAAACLTSRLLEAELGPAPAHHRQAIQDVLEALLLDVFSEFPARDLRIADLRSALRIVGTEGVSLPKAALEDSKALYFFVTRFEDNRSL